MYEITFSYTILVGLENHTCEGKEPYKSAKLGGIDR